MVLVYSPRVFVTCVMFWIFVWCFFSFVMYLFRSKMFKWVSFVVFGGYGMCGSFWIGDGIFCRSFMSVLTFLL